MEFINFVPQNKMMFYYGSKTSPTLSPNSVTPDCDETVMWVVNTSPHVITKAQVQQLNSLLNLPTVTAGGNYRNIQNLNSR